MYISGVSGSGGTVSALTGTAASYPSIGPMKKWFRQWLGGADHLHHTASRSVAARDVWRTNWCGFGDVFPSGDMRLMNKVISRDEFPCGGVRVVDEGAVKSDEGVLCCGTSDHWTGVSGQMDRVQSLPFTKGGGTTVSNANGWKCKDVMDVHCYQNRYKDLEGAFKGNIGALASHWINHGSKEGRKYVCDTTKQTINGTMPCCRGVPMEDVHSRGLSLPSVGDTRRCKCFLSASFVGDMSILLMASSNPVLNSFGAPWQASRKRNVMLRSAIWSVIPT